MADALNVPQEAGLLVQRVARGSPAARLGLMPGRIRTAVRERELLIGGDIILAIQGTRIQPSTRDLCALQDLVGGFTSESRIEMTVLRSGRKLRLSTEP
jgi:S1-C subfamily serine protease